MEAVLIAVAALLAAGCVWLAVARERAVRAQHAAERDLAVARQQLAEAQNRLPEFERLRQESLQAAQAAMLKTAQELSSKLLDDHKRENAEAKKQAEAQLKELAQPLVDHATNCMRRWPRCTARSRTRAAPSIP